MSFCGKNKQRKGFSLVEIMLVLLIFTVIVVVFYKTFTIGMKLIAESKNRAGAVALANEKMEIIRNLNYPDVGTQGGTPSGGIKQDEDLTVNGRKYHVRTLIEFKDDPFDGTALASTDSVPNDYKETKLVVSWISGNGISKSVTFISSIVPPGLETSYGDGVLAINVMENTGATTQGLQATLNVHNDAVSPAINMNTGTDSAGHKLLIGLEESSQKYEISISKSGYESFATLDPDQTVTGFVPKTEFTHASVQAGMLNTYDYIINKLSTLKVQTIDPWGTALPNMQFDIKGGKLLGTEISDGSPHYNFSQTGQTTDAAGEKEFTNISPGGYEVTSNDSNYAFAGYDPIGSSFTLNPGASGVLKMKLIPKNFKAVLVKVVDKNSTVPIAGAEVTLKDGINPDIKITTLEDGLALFPTTNTPLSAGNYILEVKAAGYIEQNDTVNISGLLEKTVEMEI